MWRTSRHISSAKEDYSDLIEDFEVERFFSDAGGFQPLFTSFQELEGISSQMVEPQSQHAQRANSDLNTTSGNNSVRRVHPSSVHSVTNTNNKGPAKPPVAIPKHLQNTPYFSAPLECNGSSWTAWKVGNIWLRLLKQFIALAPNFRNYTTT
jgi:hypothetical protein